MKALVISKEKKSVPFVKYERFKNNSDEKAKCKESKSPHKLFMPFALSYVCETIPKYKRFY